MRTDFDADAAQKAMLREGLAYVAHGILAPFGLLRSRHRPLRAKDIRTLVFVHGLGANRAGFFPLQAYLKLKALAGARTDRQLAYNHGSSGSIEAMAIHLKQEIDANIKGGRIDLIAHSMGGVIARYYLQQLGGNRRVDRLITLASPHLGTEAFVYVPTALVGQLSPKGRFLEHLNQLPPPEGVKCFSFAGGQDAVVIPRENAFCPFGEQKMFEELGHSGLLLSPLVFSAVAEALAT